MQSVITMKSHIDILKFIYIVRSVLHDCDICIPVYNLVLIKMNIPDNPHVRTIEQPSNMPTS